MKKAASYSLSRKLLLMLLFVVSCSTHAMAQSYFYYYKGNKIPLTLNENRVIVSISKDCEETIERIRTNVQVLSTIKDETLDIIIISRSDFEKLASQDFWEEDAKSVILTSSFFTEDNEEVFETPYLDVELKKNEDIDLLNTYAEQYKLRNAGKSYFTLWYILAITPESEKSSLECANELYESGVFAASVADLASADMNMAIRSIISATTEEYSGIYDLQGRRMAEGRPLHPGIYVKDGRKFVVK